MLNTMREAIPKLSSDNIKNSRKNLTVVSEVLKNNLFLVRKALPYSLHLIWSHRQHTLVLLTQTYTVIVVS